MKLTKAQSKRLRYICGVVAYNQPCVKKYTGGPEGKIRAIGKFKYIENGDELVSLEYDGDAADLSNYAAEEFLVALADDSGFHLGGCIHVEDPPSADMDGHGDIETATEMAVEHQLHAMVPPENTVHEINIQAEVQPADDGWMDADGNAMGIDPGMADTPELLDGEENAAAESAMLPEASSDEIPEDDSSEGDNLPGMSAESGGWMDDEGNDPDGIDQGTADIPELLTEEERKAAEEDGLPPAIDTSTEVPPVEMTEHAFTKEDAEKSIEDTEDRPLTGAPTLPLASPGAFKGIKIVNLPPLPVKTPKQMSPEELTEDVIREISMTAAAREAARHHQIEYYNMPDIPSQNIIRANAAIPGFLDDYGKCLKKVGMARTLTEIAKALPGQIDWIFR